MPTTFPGACFCGAIRYTLTAAPIFVQCCHCTDCQTQTGGGFAINAMIEASHVVVEQGTPVAVAMPTESGRPHDIYRCPACATALWSDYGRRKTLLFVRVSTLTKPHPIEPALHIFTRSKLPWVLLPPDARAFDVYYDMQKEWPPESLARRAVLTAKPA